MTGKLTEQQINELMYGDEVPGVESEGQEVESQEDLDADLDNQQEQEVRKEKLTLEPKKSFFQKPLDEMSEEEMQILAQDQGWNPNFKGKNAKTAKEYLEKTETEVPVMRDTIRRMAEQMEQMKAAFERQRDIDKKKYEKEIKQQIELVSNEKQKLKETGLYEKEDFDKYEKISQDENNLKSELENLNKEVVSPNSIGEREKVILSQWVAKNNWYGTDLDMTQEADAKIPVINQIYKDASPEKKLEILERHIKKKFPEMNEDAGQERKSFTNKVQVSDRASNVVNSTNKAKRFSFNDLTPEDKKNFETFRRMNWGLKKDSRTSSEEFNARIQKTEQEELQNYYEDYKSQGLIK